MATQKSEVTIRTRNLVINPLLCRKQCVVDIYHPGIAQPKFTQIKEQIAKMYKVKDVNTIVLSGFATKFGGGKTTGFALIYDTIAALKKFVPRYYITRSKIEMEKPLPAKKPRKARKEFKKKWRMCHSFKDYKKKEAKKASRKKK